jgi:HTH-type transcriptional regulator/antitoxin HigA
MNQETTMTAQTKDLYLALVQEVSLRPIRSEKQLDRAIAMLDALSDREKLTLEEQDYKRVLSSLVREYEKEHYPMSPVTGTEMLQYLIEMNGVSQNEVAAATGIAESTLSAILTGKRQLGAKYMGPLARYFHVSPGVFVSE